MDASDKEWARKYILDPLTAPEPSQETGLGTSHVNHRGSLTYTTTTTTPPAQNAPSQSRSASNSVRSSKSQLRNRATTKEPSTADSVSSRGLPTPPSSASPTQRGFDASNPFADAPPPYTPTRNTQSSSSNRAPSINLSPPRSERNRSTSNPTPLLRPTTSSHTRNRSLNQRYPGDMSHRPLDIIKRETRAADRLPRGHRKQASDTDIIDALDTIAGAPYHHGGPYDATLASRNVNKHYSPVAAVKDSNAEALRATPREYVQDSLTKHVPLQGTAVVPSGSVDMSGRVMDYREGADLMREADAPGGAYKRWDGIQYHPNDLKGKSEPSYTYEEDLKKGKAKHADYEMQSGLLYPQTRMRSVSNTDENTRGNVHTGTDGVQRSHSTGKHAGLRERIHNIGRKKSPEERA